MEQSGGAHPPARGDGHAGRQSQVQRLLTLRPPSSPIPRTVTSMPELIAPTTRLHAAWLASRDEWGRGVHQDGAGMRPQDEYDTREGFARWVRRLTCEEDTRIPPGPDWVHCTY